MINMIIRGKVKTFYTFTQIHNFIRDAKNMQQSEKNELVDKALKLLKSMPYDFDTMDYHKNSLESLRTPTVSII